MKSVLISIQPKWCELIASGEKTVEVRKTKPKLKTPFKVYIYETLGKTKWCNTCKKPCERPYPNCACHEGWGKVIGEFVCDTFIIDKTFGHDALFNAAACLSDADAASYCLNKEMYGWHISDLVIYDKPRELSDFVKYRDDWGFRAGIAALTGLDCNEYITRPPQSWCYVEDTE